MSKLIIECIDDADDVLEFETDTAREPLAVDVYLASDDFPTACICIDKNKAAQIVNHLITVFEITPEQRIK